MKPETPLFSLREDRLIECFKITLSNILDQGLPLRLQGIVKYCTAN